MTSSGFSLFDTPIGQCGLVWGPHGVLGVQLPERHPSATRARLIRRYPDAVEKAPPPDMQQAIEAIRALLSGERRDLSAIPLDMDGVPPLHRKIYVAARTIPPGTTLSYGEIATRIGDRSAAREVGEAMGRNPFPLIVPCHRVLAAGGGIGGFSAAGGVTTKLRLLNIEEAQIGDGPTLFKNLPLSARPVNRAARAGE